MSNFTLFALGAGKICQHLLTLLITVFSHGNIFSLLFNFYFNRVTKCLAKKEFMIFGGTPLRASYNFQNFNSFRKGPHMTSYK